MGGHPHTYQPGRGDAQRLLIFGFSITIGMTVAEVIGGVLSNSLALIGDAGHMFMDSLALGMSMLALKLAQRPATKHKTYGYYRLEILAALANGILLILVSLYIFYEAYLRFTGVPEVKGPLMLAVAAVGLAVNMAALFLLRKVRTQNLNVKGAFMHVLGDTVSSVGVIAAALVISFTGAYVMDPLAGLLIGGIILRGAIGLIAESGGVLLEAVPEGVDVDDVVKEIKKVEGVRSVHDLHLWAISSGINAMSGHVVIEDQMVSRAGEVLGKVTMSLKEKFSIVHTTIQLECKTCKGPFVCSIVTEKKR